jgi:hypothetical protein
MAADAHLSSLSVILTVSFQLNSSSPYIACSDADIVMLNQVDQGILKTSRLSHKTGSIDWEII